MTDTNPAHLPNHDALPLAPRHPDTRLEADWLFLYHQLPPKAWHDSEYAYKTSFWLNIHADLRHSQKTLNDISALYQADELTWTAYRKHILPRMRQYIFKLHQHHHIEDTGYFPHFVRQYPQLQAGFDILAHDHMRLDTLLNDWQLLNQTLADSEAENKALAAQLHDTIMAADVLLSQHLSDEEDLVIPILGLN